LRFREGRNKKNFSVYFEGTDIAEQYMTEVSDEAIDALIQEGSIMYTCGAVRVEARTCDYEEKTL